jgi:hypothetical protein
MDKSQIQPVKLVESVESVESVKHTNSNISYDKAYNKIIMTFPIYYKIFNEYYSKNKDVSQELNRLYKPIFMELLNHYDIFMVDGIRNIISDIKKKYNPDKSYAIIDYLEYLFGNILYETFLFEIKKINLSDIRYEHLCVFEYIVNVETIKYSQYFFIINQFRLFEPESKFILAMENRIDGCIKKIALCLSLLKRNYPNNTDVLNLSNQIIEENCLETKISQCIESVDTINSFMELHNKKKSLNV